MRKAFLGFFDPMDIWLVLASLSTVCIFVELLTATLTP